MAEPAKYLVTPLKRVRGLGSAQDGTGHFWWQRLTAVALVPLSLWFVYSLLHLVTSASTNSPLAVATWFSELWHALAMVLFLLALFYHSKLGIQVIIEDYVHRPLPKYFLLLLSTFAHVLLAAVSLFSILKLHFLGIGPTGA